MKLLDKVFRFFSPEFVLLALFGAAVGLGLVGHAHAQVTSPAVLVAKADLQDRLYSKTVLVTMPIGSERHVGFILNKPTPQSLGTLFPNEAAAVRVNAPVYLGGPLHSEAIFALVKSKDSPGTGSIPFVPGLWLAVESEVIDAVIEKHGTDARYLAGMVLWKPGELAQELKRGIWHVLQPDIEYVFHKDTESMWEALAHRGSMMGARYDIEWGGVKRLLN